MTDFKHVKIRIVWCDDERDKNEFEEFLAAWQQINSASTIEFVDWKELANSDGDEGDKLRQALTGNPPDLLLLDWEEGATVGLWGELLRLNSKIHMALMSFSPRHMIEMHSSGGFEKYCGLTFDRVLTRPFGVDALRALLPLPYQLIDQIFDLPTSYGAWRWLNDDFDYLPTAQKVSAGWKLGWDRPKIQPFTEFEKKQLRRSNDSVVRHFLWHELPGQPGRFDRLMLETRPLLLGDLAPLGACYVQQAVESPVRPIDRLERNIIRDIMRLMDGAGFKRGRYYHHNKVPGLKEPVFELLMVEPRDPTKQPPPAVAALDKPEKELVQYFLDEYKRQAHECANLRELIHKKINISPDDLDNSNDENIWSKYIDTSMIKQALVVPVYFTDHEYKDRVSKDKHAEADATARIRGIFIFDTANLEDIQDRRIKIVAPALMAALTTYKEQRTKARGEYERKRLEKMADLHANLGKSKVLDEVAELACKTVLDLISISETEAESDSQDKRQEKADRSAIYVRYSHTQRHLELKATERIAGAEAPDCPLQKGDVFELARSHFFLARAAQTALKKIEEGDFQKAAEPLLLPDVTKLPVTERLTIEDWVCIFSEATRADAAHHWYNTKVKAVLALPVLAQDNLQGVLVVRSDRVYEFTQRRVKAVVDVVEAMQAHLVRVALLQRGKAWHGLLAHELRSILNRIDRALATSDGQSIPKGNHARALLKHALSLAQGSLHLIHGDRRSMGDAVVPMTMLDLRERVNEFGSHACQIKSSADDVDAKWVMEWGSALDNFVSPKAPELLFRVLLMLIDNAYRHATFKDEACAVGLLVTAENNQIFLNMCSPGQWPNHVILYWNDSIQNLQWLDETQDVQRHFLGLSLMYWLCSQVGARVRLENYSSQAVVNIEWPLQIN